MSSRCPWISISRQDGPFISISNASYEALPLEQHKISLPSIIMFVGKKEKSHILEQLLPNEEYPKEHHSQILLWRCPDTDNPTLIADCEIQNHTSSHWRTPHPATGPGAFSKIQWASAGKGPTQELGASICSRILMPLASVLCIFASDFGGLLGAAKFISKLTITSTSHDLEESSKPHILVIANTKAMNPDNAKAEQKVLSSLQSADHLVGHSAKNYHSIRVVQVPNNMNRREKAKFVRTSLLVLDREARAFRATHRVQFSFAHFQALSSSLVDHFCKAEEQSFSFLRKTRSAGFINSDFEFHLSHLLSLMPNESWIWHLVVPLVSSALHLATYPPGSHPFDPSIAFQALYKRSCQVAIQKFTGFPSTHEKFIRDIEEQFCQLYTSRNQSGASSLNIHLESLNQLQPYLSLFKSHQSCFICLMRAPEKVLECGHSYCDVCIRSLGCFESSRHTYSISQCAICSASSTSLFKLLPPTAGIRILSIDGGGIRGIIPLTILNRLQEDFAYLGCSIRDYHDLVVGTSSGGLSSIGICLMNWSPQECLQKFRSLVKETFGRRKNLPAFLNYAETLLLLVLDKCRYSSTAIKASFETNFGPVPKMFNPLATDTKVAVITTPIHSKVTSVLCNYNGIKRPKDIGYRIIRADEREDDVNINEAATCTTAAPGFFKPILLKYFGPHQDGALHHNNPSNIALWELPFLWPNRGEEGQPDYILSLGTGMSTRKLSGSSHFLSSVSNAFDWHLDSDRAWKHIINSTPPKYRHKYHRLNLSLEIKEPQIDDTSMIDHLEHETLSMLNDSSGSSDYNTFKDYLLSSIFYFEMQNIMEDVDKFRCTGYIRCRLDMPKEGRQALYNKMTLLGAYFIVNGTYSPCIKTTLSTAPPYRCRIQFTVEDLKDKLFISLNRLTEEPRQISGLPKPVNEILSLQGINAPFGRSDHHIYPRGILPRKRTNRS